ncbi:MAG: 4'-phosphopantetheinyl transferase superfamily protein [Jatrophihabitantaceae bacterium]
MNWRPESPLDTVYVWVLRRPQRSRTGARQVLAEVGARVLGANPGQVEVSQDSAGQPVLRSPSGRLWVSLSYGPEVLALAASLAGPVGIDIEGARPAAVTRLADRWFDAAGAQWVREQQAAEQLRAFLLLWTAKEALGKALGTGLRGSGLRRVVPLPPVTDGSFQPVPGGLRLAHPALGEDLVLAVATGPGAGGVSTVVVERELGHLRLARSTARSRTSLPVVVRGNGSRT